MKSISIPKTSFSLAMSTLAIAWICSANFASAEQWSDATGKFQIDAEYVRVEGKSVLLRKPDGSTLTVPISRLSEASRAQAKKLYAMSKAGGATALAPTKPAMSGSSTKKMSDYRPPGTYDAVAAPAVPTLAAMPAFPSQPSLEEQVTFVRQQVMAGHLEVFWYALPDEMRAAIDSQEFRDVLRPQIKEYEAKSKPMEGLVTKLLNVLTTKKEYVLGTSMLAAIPPGAKNMVMRGYDPGVGLIYEVMVFSDAQTTLPENTMSSIVDYHAPRIGAHLSKLISMLPPEQVEQFTGSISVQQSDDNSGSVTIPGNGGVPQTIEMARVDGRWIPRDLAEKWAANKDSFADQFAEMLQSTQQLGDSPEAAAQVAAISGQVGTVLDGMLAATNQQEFDQVVTQVFQQAMMMFGGGFGGGAMGGPDGPPAGF